jgi:hypothetical protein
MIAKKPSLALQIVEWQNEKRESERKKIMNNLFDFKILKVADFLYSGKKYVMPFITINQRD